METERDPLNLEEAFELARECLKSLLVINGGAAVAILAFYGSALTKDGLISAETRGYIAGALYWFAAGAFSTTVTFMTAYVVELLWGGGYPSGAKRERGHKWAQRLHMLALTLTLASAAFFVAGVSDTRHAILDAPIVVGEKVGPAQGLPHKPRKSGTFVEPMVERTSAKAP
jgi:hypothetical protein